MFDYTIEHEKYGDYYIINTEIKHIQSITLIKIFKLELINK